MMPAPVSGRASRLVGALLLLCLLLLLWQGSSGNQVDIPLAIFLPLHSVLELFSIVVSALVFVIAFGTRDTQHAVRVALAGCLFLATALFDAIHLLSYAGMPDLISPNTPDKSIWFWLAARVSAGLGLLAYAMWPPTRTVQAAGRWYLLAGTVAVVALLAYVLVFQAAHLPAMHVADVGLTALKITFEWSICGLYLLSAGLIYRRRHDNTHFDSQSLMLALLLMAAGELLFTVYVQVSSLANLAGHVYKVLAYGFLYRAIFTEAIQRPFQRIEQLKTEVEGERDFVASLVNTAPVIILLLDSRGMVEYVNPYFEQLTGYRMDQIRGKEGFATLLPQRKQAHIRALFHSSTRQAPTRGDIIAIVTRTGEEREIAWNSQPRHDASGRLTGLLAIGQDVTGQRQLAQELRRAYGQNQAVTQAIHDNLYMLDGSGRLTWWNRQLEEVTGLTPATLRGMSGLDCFVAEDRVAVEQALGKVLADGYGSVEARLITRNGPVWYHYNGVRVQDAQGRVIGIAGVGRDITERIKAQEAARHNERTLMALNESLEERVIERTVALQQQNLRVETILKTAIDGFFSADSTGRIHDANPAFCAMLGYSEAELQQLTIPDFEANENPADVATHIEKVLAQGHDRFDTRYRRRDASLVEVEISVSLVELDRRPMFYAFARDITERKRMEDKLRSSRAEIKTTLDAFPGVVATLGDDLIYRYANRRFASLLGKSPEQVVGRNVLELQGAERAAEVREQMARTRADASLEFERRFPATSQRGEVIMQVGYAPRVNPRTGEWLYYGFGTDVTNLKRVQAALQEARDVAETASRAKSEFLASISHELRTPLNAVLGFSQLLGTNPDLSEEVRDQAREIESAGRHLLSLVNDVIDLARIESGRLELALKPVRVQLVLADSLALLAPLAHTQGIELLQQGCADATVRVRADAVRLRQVLINLLSNAIKYNRPSGTVSVYCETVDGRARLSVIDTGPGIAADKQARLFNAFDRLGREAGTLEGTGIGLVITKRLVEAMGGEIGFESVEGQGSSFWVELPFSAPVEGPAVTVNVPVNARDLMTPSANRGVVLYIEDNAVNLRLMQKIFARRKNLTLRHAPTAEIGIELSRAEPPALILMDINLGGGMNGHEALKVLKADPRTAHIAVMALTAYAMNGDELRGLAAGFCDYVTKPLDVKQFMHTLDHFFADNPESSP